MAEMIPPYIYKDIKSVAERKIFELIKKDSLLSECTCFHSLGLARHQNKIYGEIDFVLLSEGGIFCLEVKRGGIKREKDVWVFRTDTVRSTIKEMARLANFLLRYFP
jgi:hypothetical protein